MAKQDYYNWLKKCFLAYKNNEKVFEELASDFEIIAQNVYIHSKNNIIRKDDALLFIFESVAEALSQSGISTNNFRQDINDHIDIILEKMPKIFAEKIRKMPLDYIFSFPFRLFYPLPYGEYVVTDNVTLIHENPAAYANRVLHPMSSEFFIDLKISGCCSGSKDDNASSQALSKIRCLLYALLCEDLVIAPFGSDYYNNLYFSSPIDLPPRVKAFESNSEKVYSILIDGNLHHYINNIYPSDGLFEAAKSNDIEKIKLIFRNPANFIYQESNDLMPIKSAMNWALQANYEDNSIQSFIQISIAFEALFTEGTDYITKTIANRCAYLLGKTRFERNEIINDFVEFYNTRSKIVHGKLSLLEPEHFRQLKWGREMIFSAIKKEYNNHIS